jgi:glutathione synthase/RimK-type ligase-like ATP-grasp enzyme/gamma-glutamyl:cysteine ligase YbdK (ATP-grasp superfamily)
MSRRRVLVVVSDPADAPGLPADRKVTADQYLEGSGALSEPGMTVVNLCRSYRYRTKGYYVSLLADARGQQVVPSVETIEGLADPFGLFRVLQESGVATVGAVGSRARRRALPPTIAPEDDDATAPREHHTASLLRVTEGNGLGYRAAGDAETTEALAYFGRCTDRRFSTAALAVYREWPVPVLRLHFVCEEGDWKVTDVDAVPLHSLSKEERAPLIAMLGDEKFVLRRGSPSPREGKRASIAVLVDETDHFSPSSPETIDRLERVASRMNVYVHRIGLDDITRLGEYDALFIRAITGVREPAFQWALRAEALDMPVIDDSQSIIRCSNKVFLEELLRREGIPTPRTLVVTAKTPWAQLRELGSPLVIKLPDGSFSAAVHKISSQAEYRDLSADMFRRSPLIIAQEYLPTEFDWRITVLDGKLLFAARYYMARGHWQIRSEDGSGGARYGRVQATPRDEAPREVVELGLRAAALIGTGLYGVDIKETPAGPVVIEINDNPNLDVGYDDAADGNVIYEDIVAFFLRQIEDGSATKVEADDGDASARGLTALREPIRRQAAPAKQHYRPFAVAGMELEYAVVDRDLNAISLVEDAFRVLAGRATSDVDLGSIGFSNEIADHVFELKTQAPVRSLRQAEDALVEGVRRFADVLREQFDARLLPTGMHPWLDPRKAKLWTRSNSRIYNTYARLFDVKTHGWMNVHAAHLNLPMGRENEAVAMHNAAALLIPYLPALAASSPMHDGELQQATDNRLAWILEHQARVPESCGAIVPEYVESFGDYRKRVLGSMYTALDDLPDSAPIRQEFFNTRGAILRFGRKAMEIRVLDTQECVKLDVAVAVFVRSALRHLTKRVLSGKLELPEHDVMVADFRATIRHGSAAWVAAPHLGNRVERRGDGQACVRSVLQVLLDHARKAARKDEIAYLDLVERIIQTGSLSERIRAALLPHVDNDEAFTEAARRVYIELMDCLELNEPWKGRGW